MSFIESHEFVVQLLHPCLGQIDIWQCRHDGSLAFSKLYDVHYSRERLKCRSDWQHPNVIELLAAELHSDNTQSYVAAYYQYFEYTLQEYLYEAKLPLPESEVLHILEQAVSAIRYMNSQGESCDLRTTCIFRCADGTLKFIENSTGIGNSMLPLGLMLFEVMSRESYHLIMDADVVNWQFLEFTISGLPYSNTIRILKELLNDHSTLEEVLGGTAISSMRGSFAGDISMRAKKAIQHSRLVIQRVNSIPRYQI